MNTLKNTIKRHLAAGTPPLILGKPGEAKSQVAQELAKEMGLKFVDFRASDCSPVDLGGFPFANPETGKMDFLPIAQLPLETDQVPEGYNGFLLCIEEATSAVPAVQAALT